MSYYVMATNQARQRLWRRIFGQDVLPVLADTPRPAEHRHGSRLVYDLALDQLHPQQVRRLAAWMAKRQRMEYDQARRWIATRGVHIIADEVVVVTADEQRNVHRPFVFARKQISRSNASHVREWSAYV